MGGPRAFLTNHVLANLVFSLVLVLGVVSYGQMPRAKDPQINLNWVNVVTTFPGASAADIERRVTDPFEEAIQRGVRDIRFVSSTSREGSSNILVRFEQLDARIYDKRVNDLRREIQNTYTGELPSAVDDPFFYEITSSNWFPTATIVVTAAGDDENLRRRVRNIKRDLERIKGVDRINAIGLRKPEMHVSFDPAMLSGIGISPHALADTVNGYFRDVAAGDFETDGGQWLVRIAATDADPERLAKLPVVTASGIIKLGSLATVSLATEEPTELVSFKGEPAILLAITKEVDANIIDLIEVINRYAAERNELANRTGVTLHLVDDQTVSTKKALRLMQTNALIGLTLVLAVTWLFLGTRISVLTSIGIPFTLAGTFIVLNMIGMTVNNTVLLGVVIALGMLVDDAVVVVESIYQRLRCGIQVIDAVTGGLREVIAPVTTSVLTTMAAFLPLTLLPGVLGEFMRVVPIVVTVALAVSLVEAYWMLPAHLIAIRISFCEPSSIQRRRERFTHQVRLRYTQLLVRSFRHPVVTGVIIVAIFALAVGAVVSGKVRINFFEGDAVQLFYVNVEMPPGTTLAKTAKTVRDIEQAARSAVGTNELRATVAYAGRLITETDTLFGDVVGQVMVSLQPRTEGGRGVFEIADAAEVAVRLVPGPMNVSLLRLTDGPPTRRPISIKVRGDDYPAILSAIEYLQEFMDRHPHISNTAMDYRAGNPELLLRHNGEAIKRAGLDPQTVNRAVMLYVDGEIVADFQHQGEEVRVRVLPQVIGTPAISDLLRQTISLPDGRTVALGELVDAEEGWGKFNIRHHDFRRAITLEADIDKLQINTIAANELIAKHWAKARTRFPDISLDFSGELDDIEESLDSIVLLFLLGIGLMYIILGTQFRSYWQPLLILFTVPLAFTGVVLGLLATNNPLSLYSMYGTVALAGIAVNSAIVLISAANARLAGGMSLLHATIYAARRRVIPILITSATTVAGLLSLALGLAGHSLIWGPVATSIVWGLSFSSVLTLLLIPLLFMTFMRAGSS